MAGSSAGRIDLDLILNRRQFDQQMSGIMGIAKKAGAALAGAFAFKKLWDFGKSSIELGSKLAEVDNVIQQAVPSMEKQIDAFAKSAIQSFGMSEISAKRFTGVFASMARGFGFSEQAAASMGTTLTGLAADVASFYDTGIDEAYTKLKSVFTGETETLKDLGIVMTQSALDAYALANGYGQTTKTMSEAEKVALRYAYVQEQLQFAEGDFARTSGNWANQVRILSEQFNALKATIGQGLINVLSPVLRVINMIISKLMSLANAFKAFTEMLTGNKGSGGSASVKAVGEIDAITEAADGASGALGGTGGAAKKAAKDIKGVSTGIDELNIINPQTDSGGGGGGSGGGGGGGYNPDEFDMGEINTAPVDELDNKYAGLIERLKELGNLFKEGFKIGFGDTSVLESIKGHLDGIKVSLKDIFTDKNVMDAGHRLADSLALNLGKAAGSVASVGATIADNLLGGIDKYLKKSAPRIKKFIKTMFDGWSDIANTLGDFSVAFADVFSAFRSEDAKQITADIIGIFAEFQMGMLEIGVKIKRDVLDTIFTPFVENKDVIKRALEDTLTTVSPLVTSLKTIVEDCFRKLNEVYDKHVKPMFNSFRDGFSQIVGKFVELYNQHVLPVLDSWAKKFEEFRVQYLSPLIDKFSEFAGKVADAITQVWEECLLPFVMWFMETAGPYISLALQQAQDAFLLLLETIGTVVSNALSYLEGLIDFIVGVFTGDWSRAWDGIKQMLDATWQMMKDLVKFAIEFISLTIGNILARVKLTWESIWTNIKNFLKLTWDNIKLNVETTFNNIRTFISNTIDNIQKYWSDRWEEIKEKAAEIWADIKQSATEIFEAIQNKLAEIWDKVKETIEEKWNAIKEWFDEIWKSIKEIFNLDEMVQVGKDIMTSLWDGLKDIWRKIEKWLGEIANFVGEVWSGIVDGAKKTFTKAQREAEEEGESSREDSGRGGRSNNGPGVKGNATGGFPKSGSMFVANEDGKPELIGSWGGKAAVANNMQITEGITRAVQYGMRSAVAPLVNSVREMAATAAPPLAMVGSPAVAPTGDSQLQDMVSRAIALSQQSNGNDSHLSTMVDLLRNIIELIENMELSINFDIRELSRKLKDLEKRQGYNFG